MVHHEALVPSSEPAAKKVRIEETKTIVVRCTEDGSTHVAGLPVIRMSTVVASMVPGLDDDGGNDAPVTGVGGTTMTAVLGFCDRLQRESAGGAELSSKQLRDAVFRDEAGVTLQLLQKVINAANLLDIEPLANAACAIENTELPQLTMVKELLPGSPAPINGRPSHCVTILQAQMSEA